MIFQGNEMLYLYKQTNLTFDKIIKCKNMLFVQNNNKVNNLKHQLFQFLRYDFETKRSIGVGVENIN